MADDPRNILIIKPSSLGDVATALPMLSDLHAKFPKAKIDWMIHPSLTALVQGHEHLHRLLSFDRKKLSAWWFKPAAFKLFRDLLKRLRSANYDCVIDAQGLFRSGFFTRITGAKTCIGFASAREGATLAYTHTVKLPEGGKSMVSVNRMRALLGPLGITPTLRAQAMIPLQPEAAARAKVLLSNIRPVILIPGARWDTKRWPIERYTDIARKLLERNELVVLLGSPDEKKLCDQMVASLTNQQATTTNLRNLAGTTSLAEMIALLDRAKLVIGNDSGPLHVAVALNKPTVSIYGPTSPAFVGPYEQLENVLRHDVSCHPCRRKECDHHSCMQGVPVELVWEKTKKVASFT